jgi:hypothetical protein
MTAPGVRRARAIVVLLTVVAALVAGCASVPTSGPVRSGGGTGDRRGDAPVAFRADRPRPGSPPLAVVNDFIVAMLTSVDTAKLYMTAKAAADWQPAQGITLFDGSDQNALRLTADKSVRLDAPLVARLDSRGRWANADSSVRATFDFDLVQEHGEWRVSAPPKGLLVPEQQFISVYQARSLYFFTPKLDVLVPDLVYLPVLSSGVQEATVLVQALLAGPTATLGDAVQTVAPPGTQVVSVPVDADGVATVALNDKVAGLEPDLRRKLAAQLAWTLDQVAGVEKIRLTVNGAPYEIDGTGEPQTIDSWRNYDAAYGVGAGHLFVRHGKAVQPVGDVPEVLAGRAELGAAVPGLSVYDKDGLAVDIDGKIGAAFTGDDVLLGELEPSKPGLPERIPTTGTPVLMSFDKDDNLWIVDRHGDGSRVRVHSPDGKTTTVEAPRFAHADVTQLRVARDGVRVVGIIHEQRADLLVTGRIVRSDDGISILGVTRIPVAFTRLEDVGWTHNQSSVTKLVLLGSDGSGRNQIEQLNVDGSEQAPVQTSSVEGPDAPSVFAPDALAVSPDPDSLLAVHNSSGEVLVQQGDLTWRVLAKNGMPVYAG